jgi:hypothetical protein
MGFVMKDIQHNLVNFYLLYQEPAKNFYISDDEDSFPKRYKIRYIKKYILRKSSYICQCCSKTKKQLLKENSYLTIHHIQPVDFGGLATIENSFVCCVECHNKIHDYISCNNIENDFLEHLKFYLLGLENVHFITLNKYNLMGYYVKIKDYQDIL